MLEDILNRCKSIPELNFDAMDKACRRLNDLTKPLGSLGVLEEVIVQLAGMTGKAIPALQKPHVLIFAADHGVSAAGVSAYGSEVTEEMTVNMCMGSAVSSVLARAQGVELQVVDVGIRTRVRHPGVVVKKVAMGTKNFVHEPAMTPEQAIEAVAVGMKTAAAAITKGADVLLLGEMGIGNTTASTAMIASLLSVSPDEIMGVGTGISEERLKHKQQVVEEALRERKPCSHNPWDVLTKLGGFEIAAMAGAMIAAASSRVPILLDGVIVSAAALFATRVHPRVRDYMLATHLSSEPAHKCVLDELKLSPLVSWGMHLGEASGALSLLPVLQNACTVMAETATFEDARVSNPHLREDPSEARPAMEQRAESTSAPVARDFDEAEVRAVYKAIVARRDIRAFLPNPVSDDVLSRIFLAAHYGPSVGYMQPWNFILIRDKEKLKAIQRVVERERVRASEHYQDLKQDYYLRLKVEGLLQAPLTICVTNDTTRGGPHVLGRNTIPETDLMSTSCAIQNMWLAARAEGLGVGWVSMYEKADLREILGIPEGVDPVALLSIGYTAHFPDIPLLERVGWGKRLDLNNLIFEENWGHPKEVTT